MVFVCSAMPQDLKSLLFPTLIGCLDGPILFNFVSDEQDTILQPFNCLHFSWYNRYTTKVIPT